VKLLTEANGDVVRVAQALWEARPNLGLDNLKGIFDEKYDAQIERNLLEYLRSVAREGVPARSNEERCRVEAKPHKSVIDNLSQVYEQMWKETRRGRTLVVPTHLLKHSNVHSSPYLAVDKMNPDRSISSSKRIVHDQRGVNAGIDPASHPPALQPRHRQLARLILHYKSRYPRIPILISKKDASGAFQLIWLRPEDCGLFAGELPWNEADMAEEEGDEPSDLVELEELVNPGAGITVINLAMGFGFNGGPGEWMPWETGIKQAHESHGPTEERRDGSERFASEGLMDDGVCVEPLIGLRPWVSGACYLDVMQHILGPESLNRAKEAVEGEFEERKTCWGLEYDTTLPNVRIPEGRILKGAHLFADSVYDPGNSSISLLDLQRARGTAQSWSPIHPSLKTELKAIDNFLGPSDFQGRVQCRPGISEREAWEDMWDSLSFFASFVCTTRNLGNAAPSSLGESARSP